MATNWLSPEFYFGKVIAFTPDPVDYRGGIVHNKARHFGECIAAVPGAPIGPREIPTLRLRVRGRSGRVVHIGVIENFVDVYESYREAKEKDNRS